MNVTGAAPTGQVFNSDSSAFVVRDKQGHSGSSVFIFDTENGTIDGWNPAVDANGQQPVHGDRGGQEQRRQRRVQGPGHRPGVRRQDVPVRHQLPVRRVEAYDGTFKPVELPGGLFVDPRLPAGYGPFGIAEISGKLYVTFAKQDATLHDDVAGPGHGFVDVFTNDGAFVRRLVTRGALDSPWGLALAPAQLRPVRRRSARRQLRQRPHQRLQPGHRRAPGPAARGQRPADRHRRAVGPEVRQRERRQDQPAALLRRA